MSSRKITNPALGMLSLLPGELRNAIYELVTARDFNEEVNVTSPCGSPTALLRTSRVVRAEASSSIASSAARPCEHTNFLAVLPTLSEYSATQYRDTLIPSLIADTVSSGHEHNLLSAKKMRFITRHLGNDVPLAVIVHLDLPEKCKIEIFGASAKRHAQVMEDLGSSLEIIEGRAKKLVNGQAVPLATLEQTLMEKEVRNIGEFVREACVEKIEED